MSLTIQSGGSVTIQSGGGGGGGGGATVGTFANRPAAGHAGALYIATDSPIAQWVDDGSAWRPLIQGQALGTQVPAASNWTSFGSGATVADNKGTLTLTQAANGSSALMRGVTIPLSSSSMFVQGCATIVGTGAAQAWLQIGLREAATGKSVTANVSLAVSGAQIPGSAHVYRQTNVSDSRSSLGLIWSVPFNSPTAVRVRRSGSSVLVELSSDFSTWYQIDSVSGAFTSAPDQVCFATAGDGAAVATLQSFNYGSL
jgi:hypothetical protein